jgi:capsular polysaccharide biosynthesis protein
LSVLSRLLVCSIVYGNNVINDAGATVRPYTFREQVEMFSSHGVLVTPHGAGLINMLFMPPLSAMIELFPYQLDHTVYATLAGNLGIGSYPVHSTNGTALWREAKVRERRESAWSPVTPWPY